MKKIYLLSSAFLLAGMSSVMGQQGMFKAQPLNNKNKTINVAGNQNSTTSSNPARAIIWSDDFSTPSNWVIANTAGNSDNWVIGTTAPNGSFPIPAIASTGNFALFDSDLLCSGDQV